MLRRSLMVIIAASSMSLAACSSFPTPDQVSEKVKEVQAAAVTACGYLPVANSVINILATYTGGGAIIGQVQAAAQGICDAVTAKGVARHGKRRGIVRATFRGVPIEGRFVR